LEVLLQKMKKTKDRVVLVSNSTKVMLLFRV
jgi:hypothetical protein